jgi:hypothetical protein
LNASPERNPKEEGWAKKNRQLLTLYSPKRLIYNNVLEQCFQTTIRERAKVFIQTGTILA